MKITKELLAIHLYHNLKVVHYADENISLECEDCCQVIVDFDVDSVKDLVIKEGKKAS